MSSDLDQGGSNRQWVLTNLGPTLGWIRMQLITPATNSITSGGTTTINVGTTLIQVNFNGSVTLQLPSSTGLVPGVPGVTIPPFLNPPPMSIVDVGGFAGAFPITVLPFGTEKINKQGSAQITVPFGHLTLDPIPTGGWNIA